MSEAAKKPISLMWADLDELFNDENETVPTEEVFDRLAARQADEHGDDLSEPCDEAKELLGLWSDDLQQDCLPMWRAAVARRQPGVHIVASEKWNDAELSGEGGHEWTALLDTTVHATYGRQYSNKKKQRQKGTPDDQWNGVAGTWRQLIEGGAGSQSLFTTGQRDTTGFSRHQKHADKEGGSCVFGNCLGKHTNAAVDSNCAIGLDHDTGHVTFKEAEQHVADVDIAAILSTTHSHLKTETEFKRDAVVKHVKCSGDPTLDDVKSYAAKEKGLAPHVIESLSIVDTYRTGEGMQILVSHEPIDKFRVIIPFAEGDVKITEMGNTDSEAHALYERKVYGVADMLGIPTDAATTNVARLFYLPRHPAGAEHRITIHQAPPISFWDIPEVEAGKAYTGSRSERNFKRRPDVVTEDGTDVSALYARYARRWMLADICETAGLETSAHASNGGGKFHVRCPFADGHTNSGDDGSTFAMNAEDSQTEFAIVDCRHGSCQSANAGDKRHTVDFLGAWIDSGELDPEFLQDPEFMLPLPDGATGEMFMQPTPDEDVEPEPVSMTADAVSQKISGLNADSTDSEVKACLEGLIAEGADEGTISRTKKAITAATESVFGANTLNRFVKAIHSERDHAVADEERERAAKDYAQRRESARIEHVSREDDTPELIVKAARKAKWMPPQYTVKDDGWIHKRNYQEPDKSLKICAAFRVVGISFTEGGEDIQVTIRFEHRSKQNVGLVEQTFALADTLKDSNVLAAQLFGNGLMLNPRGGSSKETDEERNAIAEFIHLLRSIETDREALIRSKPGWTEDKTMWMSPTGEQVGGEGREYLLNPKRTVKRPEKGGTFEGWKTNVDAAVNSVNGDKILSGTLTGLAGVYLEYIGFANSLVVVYEGESSRTKTTAQGYGVSCHTTPRVREGLMHKADASSTASENLAEIGNGAVVAMDDDGTSSLQPAEKQRLVLQWAEGEGRVRGKADASLRDSASWNTCFTLSGEGGFVAGLEAVQQHDQTVDIKAGAVARMIAIDMEDVPNLNEVEGGDEITAGYDAMVRDPANYGWAGPMFSETLLVMGPDAAKEKHENVVKRLVTNHVNNTGGKFSPTEMRIVKAMAILIASGEIAVDAGIIGAVDVFGMMEGLMLRSIERRTGHLNVSAQTLNRLRDGLITEWNAGQVPDVFNIPEHQRGIVAYYGYPSDNGKEDETATLRDKHPERTYYIPLKALTRLGVNASPEKVTALLREKGYLIEPSPKGKFAKQGYHETMPREGKSPNIRGKGEFVHGDMRELFAEDITE